MDYGTSTELHGLLVGPPKFNPIFLNFPLSYSPLMYVWVSFFTCFLKGNTVLYFLYEIVGQARQP